MHLMKSNSLAKVVKEKLQKWSDKRNYIYVATCTTTCIIFVFIFLNDVQKFVFMVVLLEQSQ